MASDNPPPTHQPSPPDKPPPAPPPPPDTGPEPPGPGMPPKPDADSGDAETARAGGELGALIEEDGDPTEVAPDPGMLVGD